MQKSHLYISVKKAYSLFMRENHEVTDRIEQVCYTATKPSDPQQSANVYTCIHYQNVILALDAMHTTFAQVQFTKKISLLHAWCRLKQIACWYHECKKLASRFETFHPLTDEDMLKLRWEEVEGCIIKTEQSGAVSELHHSSCLIMESFLTNLCQTKAV